MEQSAGYIVNRDHVPHFIAKQSCFMCLEGYKLQSTTKVYNILDVGVIGPQWAMFGDRRH